MCVQKEGSKETAEGRTKDKLWCVRRKHFWKNQLIQELKIQTVPSPCGCWRGWGIYWCWGRFHGDSVHNSMAGALNWFLFHSLMHTQKSWCRPLLLLWGTMEKRAVGLCQAPESCNLCCTWSFCRPQRVFFFLLISVYLCVAWHNWESLTYMALCQRFFSASYGRWFSVRISGNVLYLHLISHFWLEVVIMELLWCKLLHRRFIENQLLDILTSCLK